MPKAFEPTEEQRRSVQAMAGFGIRHKDIAATLDIDEKTLTKHFRTELDKGVAVANVNVGRSLYELAVGRPAVFDEKGQQIREELKPDKSAAIFASKVRLGFRENTRIEVTGANGGPIQMTELDLTVFTDEELKLFMTLYAKAKRRQDDAASAPPAE